MSLDEGAVLNRLQIIFWIALKEFRLTVRDPYVVLYLICPFILFPLALWGGAQSASVEEARLEKNPPRVAVSGDAGLDEALADESFAFVEASPDDVASGEAEIVIETDESSALLSVRIHHSSTRPDSRRALNPVRDAIKDFRQLRREAQVEARGLDLSLVAPLAIVQDEIGPEDKKLARLFGFIMSIIMVTSLVLGTLYPALSVVVNEREGSSLETTMLLPVSASNHVLAKWITCTLWSLTFAAIAGAGMALTVAQVQTLFIETDITLPIQTSQMLSAGLILIVTAGFIAALAMAIVSPARDFKQGEVLATFGMMTPLLALAMIGGMGLFTGDRSLSFLPLASTTAAIGDALAGDLKLSSTLWTCAMHACLALGALGLVSALFRREDYVSGQFSLSSLMPWRSK
jgi:ABC-type Na+ efflux pump permease subunit